jgi:cyclophilin family peptidyl-prolyl cis-trans isomerase
MWVRIGVDRSNVKRHAEGTTRKPGRRLNQQPHLEVLEDRQLLTATLQAIENFQVPAQQGYTQPLLADTGATNPQTFTVTSSNPDIAASIIQGHYWTLGISYTDPNNSQNSFTGNLTFQLFDNLTPNTVSMITAFTNDSYYVTTGKYFPRIVVNFGGTPFTVVQGGSATLDGSGSSGQPGTPFANENVQQLPLSGIDQLAMANSGGTDSNDTQFFINTGSLNAELGYGYTVFGQLLTGQSTLGLMATIPLMTTSPGTQPVNPLTITSATLTAEGTNPNGTLLLDTTQAKPGETSTITVTATEPASNTSVSESFVVTVGAYGGPPSSEDPTPPLINFRPFANATTANIVQNTASQVQLNGQSGYPDTTTPSTLTYQLLTQPTHGTVSNFNASTGTFTYTPAAGYLGPDSLTYQVSATGPAMTPPVTPTTTTSNPGVVSIVVGTAPPIPIPTFNTGTVQIIGGALVIQPVPKFHGKNTIHVAQVPDASADGGAVIQVNINGQLDATQPGINDINRIIVFGGRTARNQVVVDPSVKLATTIDSGHGTVAFLTGGGGPTREHGWFGHTTLIGGPGANQLIGLAGKVKFKPSKETTLIFAGKPRRRTALLNTLPPGGTFYRFIHGHLVPIPASEVKAGDTKANAKAIKKATAAVVNPGGPMQKAATSVLPSAI